MGPDVFQAPHFYPICFGEPCPPFIYIQWLKGGIFLLQYKSVNFGDQPWFQFLSDGPIKLAYCKNKMNLNYELPHLMNGRGE
jgi:hypothetical protein